MRVEKITKRRRKHDNTALMTYGAIGLFLYTMIANFVNQTIAVILLISIVGYAYIFLQRNELGESRKEVRGKKAKYYKSVQTYVFSKNYK